MTTNKVLIVAGIGILGYMLLTNENEKKTYLNTLITVDRFIEEVKLGKVEMYNNVITLDGYKFRANNFTFKLLLTITRGYITFLNEGKFRLNGIRTAIKNEISPNVDIDLHTVQYLLSSTENETDDGVILEYFKRTITKIFNSIQVRILI